MEVTRDDLVTRFRALSDEELLTRLQAGTLTPLAIEVAESELRSRGIEPPSGVESTDGATESGGVHEAPLSSELITVAEFWNPIQANLFRSLLESEGIFVHMWGEHLGTAHNFLSVASGGMRLQVPANQVAQAKELIAAFERGELAADEEPE